MFSAARAPTTAALLTLPALLLFLFFPVGHCHCSNELLHLVPRVRVDEPERIVLNSRLIVCRRRILVYLLYGEISAYHAPFGASGSRVMNHM